MLPLLQELNSVADRLANEAVALPGTEICISMQQTVTWSKSLAKGAVCSVHHEMKASSISLKLVLCHEGILCHEGQLICQFRCFWIWRLQIVYVGLFVQVSCLTWIATRRTFTCMAVRYYSFNLVTICNTSEGVFHLMYYGVLPTHW